MDAVGRIEIRRNKLLVVAVRAAAEWADVLAATRAVRVVLSKPAAAVRAVAAGGPRFAASWRQGGSGFLQDHLVRRNINRHLGFRRAWATGELRHEGSHEHEPTARQ
jgi:hypothetical protein